jgi:hypothetical protein
MELDQKYKKRHLAQMIVETGGWTIDVPESIGSRMIFSDDVLDKTMVESFRATYPVLV